MGLQLKIETRGIARARDAIYRIALKAGNLHIPFEVAARYLVTQTHQHFRREQSPEGDPWQQLSARYVERPRKQGGRGGKAHPILFVHGWLLNSITYHTDDKGFAVGTNRLFPGGTKSAAAIHQLGGTAGHGAKIPARPFLGVTEHDAERIGDFLVNYLGKL